MAFSEEIRVDTREFTPDELDMYTRQSQLMYKLNHTMPATGEYIAAMTELFGDRIGEGSLVSAPISGAALDRLKIGNRVFINSNLLAMARGGIT